LRKPCTRLIEHLNSNKIFVKEQFGFRKNLTTEEAIYKLTNEILGALNNKSMFGGIFCVLEKAVDFVNHDVLLSKLTYYGITGKTKLLIESYLKDRYQTVQITNFHLNHFLNGSK
jgi:hypothetical protein